MKQEQEVEDQFLVKLILEYGFCFAFSLSLYGLIFLCIRYVSYVNGTQKISKLSLRAFIFGMHFLFWQSILLLCYQKVSNEYEKIGDKKINPFTEIAKSYISRVALAVDSLRMGSFYAFIQWDCLHKDALSSFVHYQDFFGPKQIMVYKDVL